MSRINKNKNKKFNLNIGIFMRYIIDDINRNNSTLEKYIEKNKDNIEINNNNKKIEISSKTSIGNFGKIYKICLEEIIM